MRNQRLVATVGRKSFGEDKWFVYADSYKESGDVLYENIVKHDEQNRTEALIYPIVMLYRHSIELLLKVLANDFVKCNKSMKFGKIEKVLYSHELNNLFAFIKQSITDLSKYLNSDLDIIGKIESGIKYVEEVDKSSEYFRFPINKKREEHFQEETTIDLKEFKEIIDEVYEHLTSIIGVIKEVSETVRGDM